MFITLSSKKILLLLALLSVSPLALHASQGQDDCGHLLQARENRIQSLVFERTAPLRNGIPQIIDSSTGTPIPVLEHINRELAKPILDASKRAILNYLDELTKVWATAARENIRLNYDELKKNKTPLSLDADGLPMTDIVQANRNTALDVIAITQEKFKQGKIKTDKIAPIELEQQTAQLAIDQLKKKYLQKIKEKTDAVITQTELQLQQSANQFQPDWNEIIRETTPLVDLMKSELATRFPITRSQSTKFGQQATIVQKSSLPPVTLTQLNVSGTPEILLPEVGIRAYYDIELGTLVLESIRGLMANPEGLILVADHGDGTVKSNASSWKYLVPKFTESLLNPVAMNLPQSGLGMDLMGLEDTTAYLDYRFRILRQRIQPDPQKTMAPLVLLGRSMGGTKGFAHALLYRDPENVVDAYVLTSFSNPNTMHLQMQNIQRQFDAGTISGIVPQSIEAAKIFSDDLLEKLNSIRSSNPHAFDDFGDHLFFQQGNADEDGGPSVIEDLQAFVHDYAPKAHVYLFENALYRYNIPHLEKVSPDKWEGTHILFSNQSNYSRESLKKTIDSMRSNQSSLSQDDKDILEALEAIYTRVPQEDFPALQDQFIEATASMYGFFDYLADSPSMRPEVRRSSQVFSEFRRQLTGGKSYLEYYAEKVKVSNQELLDAQPGRGSRAARLKRVQEYWRSEAAKDPARAVSQD